MIHPRATLTGHTRVVFALAWGQLGGQPVLASGSADGTVRLWDPERGEELAELTDRTGPVRALAWARLGANRGPVLASGSADGAVRLWRPQLGGRPGKLTGLADLVFALAWGRLGSRPVLAAGMAGGAVWLWRLGPTEVHRLVGHTGSVHALAWGQLGSRPVLASGSADGTVRLWDPERGEELQRLPGSAGEVSALAWGQLGGRPVLASGSSENGTVRLWDPERGEESAELTNPAGSVHALAWGQLGGRPVLASGGGGEFPGRLWDPEQGEELQRLPHDTGVIFALAWGQLGGRPVLASGGGDCTVRLWDPVIERFAERLPGYRSDDLADPDRLGRDDEAAALAEMITTRSARPPLAIGLFGDWGEGKSHFLSRIAAHVGRLASIAMDDPEDGLTHSGIRQVRFNAWHYAETDLWASLVAELFGQIAAAPGDRGREERRQSRLAAELAARRQLPERLRAAQQRQQKLREELDKQTTRQWTLPLRLDPRDRARLAGLAGDQPEKLYQTMWEAASSIGGTARLAWHICARAVRRPWFWLCLAFAGAAAAAWWFFPSLPGRLATTVAGLGALLGTSFQAVRNSVNDLRDQAKPFIDQVQRYADNRRRRLQTALEVTTAQVDALQAELQDLTPAGQLTALIERRGRRDSPYRTQLGLMTQIREDFEQMARLLASASQQPLTEPDVDPVGDELPRIERIVVYIDDLDRCPPDRVVQVLEAVQLLLAVPLFVVVVAVDPRWLLRSLTVHYKELFAPDGPAAADSENWGSTPMQYLEKIFQIPFTLPAVGQTGYTTMVEALTAPAPHAEPSPSPVGPAGDSLQQIRQRLARPTAARYRSAFRRAPTPVFPVTTTASGDLAQSGPQPLPAAPMVERFDPLVLTSDERRLLALLGAPLITTPRSIKRLVNSYGLLNALRGSKHKKDLEQQTYADTGSPYYPYRAGMALLGILIAFPDLSPTFFPCLHEASRGPGSCSWAQLLKRADPAPADENGDRWSSELVGPLDSKAQARRWQKLVRALEKLTAAAADAKPELALPEPLEAWAEWVIPVGRLSFETGRSVITLSPDNGRTE